jgi:hypothetical protein
MSRTNPLPNSPPALVRQAEDQDAAFINGEHEAGEKANKKRLEHYLHAGQRLLKKLQVLGGKKIGRWHKWVHENLEFTRQTASRYMRFAERVAEKSENGFPSPDRLEELWMETRYAPPEKPTEEPEPRTIPIRVQVKEEETEPVRVAAVVIPEPATEPANYRLAVVKKGEAETEDDTGDEPAFTSKGGNGKPSKPPPLVSEFTMQFAKELQELFGPKSPRWDKLKAMIACREDIDEESMNNVTVALRRVMETCQAIIDALNGEGRREQ